MATIGTLERLSAAQLSKIILAEKAAAEGDPSLAIVDVRGDGASLPVLPLGMVRLRSPPQRATAYL